MTQMNEPRGARHSHVSPVQYANRASFKGRWAPSIRALRGIACLAVLACVWVRGDGLTADKRKALQEAGWVEVRGGSFGLLIPRDLRPGAVRPIDSIVGVWKSETIRLTYDQGAFSAPVPEGQGTESLTLDGRQARMRTGTDGSRANGFACYAQIYFPDIGIPMPIGPRLSIHANCKTATNLATVRTIFESIRFSTNQVAARTAPAGSRTNDLARPRPPSPTGAGTGHP